MQSADSAGDLATSLRQESDQTIEEMTTRMRPQRQLIKIIQGFPEATIHEVCPYTAKYFRPLAKLPLVTILVSCGVAVGLNLSCFTFVGELL